MLNKSKKYKILIDDYNIVLPEANYYLQKLRFFEKAMFITLLFLCVYIVIEASVHIINSFANPIVFGFCIFVIFIIFYSFYIKNIEKLDNTIFNGFLKSRLKIFHSIHETKDYEYEEMDYITTKTRSKNVNQVLIDLAYKALVKGAEGFIVIKNEETAILINRQIGDGVNFNDITTEIEKSGVAILIKNIKKKEQ